MISPKLTDGLVPLHAEPQERNPQEMEFTVKVVNSAGEYFRPVVWATDKEKAIAKAKMIHANCERYYVKFSSEGIKRLLPHANPHHRFAAQTDQHQRVGV